MQLAHQSNQSAKPINHRSKITGSPRVINNSPIARRHRAKSIPKLALRLTNNPNQQPKLSHCRFERRNTPRETNDNQFERGTRRNEKFEVEL